MTIKAGDKIPGCTLKTMGEKGPVDISTDAIFAGKKVLLFAVPGAFTPGCSVTHLPGYVVNADKIKAKGVDTIVCMSVNDAFVMGAWGKAQNAEELLSRASGEALTATIMRGACSLRCPPPSTSSAVRRSISRRTDEYTSRTICSTRSSDKTVSGARPNPARTRRSPERGYAWAPDVLDAAGGGDDRLVLGPLGGASARGRDHGRGRDGAAGAP
jgi:hypothetical protein